MPARTIQEVLQSETERWIAIPGVEGTAIGELDGQPCIKVFVAGKPQELVAKIPRTLDGHPVVVEETGEFRAL